MLIPFSEINRLLEKYSIKITGAFHLGAHECEEMDFYNKLGLSPHDIIWVDAIEKKVIEAKAKGIPNVYHAVITNRDNDNIIFNVSNNIQSSSVLELKTHAIEHPHIFYEYFLPSTTTTINSFFDNQFAARAPQMNFWNFDIQGAELMALQGATKYIQFAKAIYLEVNEKELYKDCGLIGDVDSFLLQYGFKRVLTKMTPHGWGDALYIFFPTGYV